MASESKVASVTVTSDGQRGSRLSDIIVQSSRAALSIQLPDGSFPPGWNGPHHDPQTPVRNTAHWLITLLKAYEISNEPRFKDAAWRAASYLTAEQVRPMGATFFCRTNPRKDFCNGLIGQAWAIEALVVAAEKLEVEQYQTVARDVFELHPFDEQASLWRRVNVDGSYNSFDLVFNHQLMFAVAGAMLTDGGGSDGAIGSQVRQFLDRVQVSHLRTTRSGRITHLLPPPLPRVGISARIHSIARPLFLLRPDPHMADIEMGYQAFNLYLFSLLSRHIPDHPLWQSSKFRSALRFANSAEFAQEVENNRYAYPYNPTGFEMGVAIQVFASAFEPATHPASWWIEQQLHRCYDSTEMLMSKVTEDGETLASRLYEATYLDDVTLDFQGRGWD